MMSRIKPMISFELGRNPLIRSCPSNFRDFIPEPYLGVLIISADFELAWAWRFAKGMKDAVQESEQYARKARRNIPVLLELCEQYDIPITWGTVGHLFLDRCQKSEGQPAHPEIRRLNYFENDWWRYKTGDWFDHDPASSREENDAWYAPDLVEQILASPVDHEIGCHTFSHIDCRDAICPSFVLQDELAACQKAADRFGIQLKSFIFPGHTMGNFQAIREAGYTSVRTNYINEIGYPEQDEYGLWHFPATAEIILNSNWGRHYNFYRYRKLIDRTLKAKAVTNLWFHPSLPSDTAPLLFEHLFQQIDRQRNRLWVTTMAAYADWLNERSSVSG